MTVEPKRYRKFLSKKIQQLNDIVADLDSLVTEIGTDFYRVSIFGSARIKPETPEYKEVYLLAKKLATKGVDIVTGGGPGLMEAANLGAKEGSNNSRSFGLHIELPFETDTNLHLDVKYHHRRFSSRLDEFMRISHAVVVTPGGIGTLLELFYTWQLMQVNHIPQRPLILLGSMWEPLLKWMEDYPLKRSLMDQKDFNSIILVRSVDEVVEKLQPHIEEFYIKHGLENPAPFVAPTP
ncbi:MAG: LOG family protein [Bdellovibrionota bacterium]